MRKLGCGARVQTKSFVLYPEYAVVPTEHVSKLQCLHQEKLSELKEEICAKHQVKTIIKHFCLASK